MNQAWSLARLEHPTHALAELSGRYQARFFQPPQQFLDLGATVYRLLISWLKTVNYQARILHQLALRLPRHRLSKGMLQKALNFLKS
ncbi:hypothetical protein HI855_04770 [Cyanobacteria bacterium 150NLHA]|uniref:hypothetical protein n=1 Tax=unclassified Prochlorococcus TaxID=2627481 RepID=UPI000AC36070|nr:MULTISPECIES: hypothetical protein [unclassified Prochlorococcus]NMP05886.1 hypothetical protein [Prochlorococcus sp. P1361]